VTSPESRRRSIVARELASSAAAKGKGRRRSSSIGVGDLLRVDGRRDHRLIAGQRQLALSPRRHVRGKCHAKHFPERRDVVVGGPATEFDDLRQQRRLLIIQHGADRANPAPLGRHVRQRDDEPGVPFGAKRYFDA